MRSCLAVFFGVWAAACATSVDESPLPELAKGGADPAVTAADPAFSKQGVTLNVRVLGSGFDAGSRAEWALAGVPVDPAVVRTNSTTFISSSELVANITVGSSAPTVLYDIIVTTLGNRRGIGTEKFEVTTATALPSLGSPGTAVANGINDGGQIAGRSAARAFVWTPGTGIVDLGPGGANDLDEAGTRVVGTTAASKDGKPMLWVGGGPWTPTQLPTSCVAGAVTGSAESISRDGRLAGGVLRMPVGRNKTVGRPVRWDLTGSGCLQLAMPVTYDNTAMVNDVNDAGMAVGMASNASGADAAVIWSPGGSATVLSPGFARAIDPAGTVVVGASGGTPAYWTLSGGAWSGPFLLSPSCGSGGSGWANDVNGFGLVVGKDCSGRARWWQLAAGVVVASAGLPGLGPQGNGRAEAVNGSGPGVPGIAGSSNDLAVYWPMP